MTELQKIDFNEFPKDDYSVQIEGKLFISDNLSPDDMRKPRVDRMDSPIQLSMNAIILCLQGEMDIKINLQDYTLSANNGVTILVESFFQITRITKDFKGCIIAISKGFINFSEDVRLGISVQQHTMHHPAFQLSEDTMEETMKIYYLLKAKLSDPTFNYKEQIAKAYLDIFKYNGLHAYHLQNSGTEEIKKKSITRREQIFSQFIQAVQENYKQQRQVIFYANLLCITPKYLSSVIHEVSGKYATDWIDQYVILEAKALLRNRHSTIKEICAYLNFANQSLFSKYFKQHTGITPKKYRNL